MFGNPPTANTEKAVRHLAGFNHSYISSHAVERAKGLIEEYELHANWQAPVDLRPLFQYIALLELELPDDTFGFALDTGQEITVAVNKSLSSAMRRTVALHEIGHICCWHPNQLNACREGQWVYNRLETEATTVAAMLLLPHQAVERPLRSYSQAKALAERYVVPMELVIVRYAINSVIQPGQAGRWQT